MESTPGSTSGTAPSRATESRGRRFLDEWSADDRWPAEQDRQPLRRSGRGFRPILRNGAGRNVRSDHVKEGIVQKLQYEREHDADEDKAAAWAGPCEIVADRAASKANRYEQNQQRNGKTEQHVQRTERKVSADEPAKVGAVQKRVLDPVKPGLLALADQVIE
jgi:hypothetical protein